MSWNAAVDDVTWACLHIYIHTSFIKISLVV